MYPRNMKHSTRSLVTQSTQHKNKQSTSLRTFRCQRRYDILFMVSTPIGKISKLDHLRSTSKGQKHLPELCSILCCSSFQCHCLTKHSAGCYNVPSVPPPTVCKTRHHPTSCKNSNMMPVYHHHHHHHHHHLIQPQRHIDRVIGLAISHIKDCNPITLSMCS